MAVQKYTISIIPPDLRQEELILQIADSLDYLDSVTQNLFSNISLKVTEFKNRLNNIQNRAQNAQAKINLIRGTSKATKVFSSYKYPGCEQLEDYTTCLSNGSSIKVSSPTYSKIHSKHENVDESKLNEKLQYNTLNVAEKKKQGAKEMGEGLGRLPRQLDSISTLLLFNTTENPYKKYVMLDPLGAVTKTRETVDETDEIGAAPVTLTYHHQEDPLDKHLFYSPELGQVPEMDVPMALPDLPGIADDLLYSTDLDPSIAPSLLAAALPRLPDIPNPSIPDLPDISPMSSAPPPPPPPPPSIPPPPPPPEVLPTPPPPAATSAVIPPTKVEPVASPEPTNQGGDARSDLLKSIRMAGGKSKLKSVQDRKLEVKKQKEEAKSQGSGDLMSDLFNKLQMRRKGISGQTRAAEEHAQATTPIEKVLRMIPAPTEETTMPEHDDDDDEWD